MVSGVVNEASSDILMMLGRMATSGVNKLARETGLTAGSGEGRGPDLPLHPLLHQRPFNGSDSWAPSSYQTKTDFRCLSRSEIGYTLFLKPSV